jgi:hypothetical protein
MENKNDNLDAQQSLDLIANMIRQTQGNVSDSSFYFLLWGWVIAICNFGMYGLMKFYSPKYAAIVWTLCIPAWIATMIYGNKQDKSRTVTTHLDKISMWLWIGLGIAIIPAWVFGSKINWMVNGVILMQVGLATFVSGIIIRFKPLVFGGITLWIGATLCYLVSPIDQYLVGGITMMLGYLVPGYMLRKINKLDQ